MKRIIKSLLLLCFACCLLQSAVFADSQRAQVSLLKKTEDTPSMAENALNKEAAIVFRENKVFIQLTFSPLDMMGAHGFLGEVSMEGVPGKVISTYKEFDDYNRPGTGKDRRMRGKAYPKVVEFPVDLSKNVYPLRFYVPIMGEMNLGEQEARLVIQYPKGLGAIEKPKKQEEKPQMPKEDVKALDLADGVYEIGVALYHDKEDKLSMGNGALEPRAEIVVENNRGRIYLGTRLLEVSKIQASLSRIFYEADSVFKSADASAFDMKVPEEDLARPRVFSFPLEQKRQWIPVKVDPKVAPMGDEPLAARLKLDFSTLKKIDGNAATLVEKAKKGSERPDFKGAHTYMDKGIKMSAPQGAFNEAFEFYGNILSGVKLQEKLKEKKLPVGTKVYVIEALTPVKEIPAGYKGSVKSLAKTVANQKAVTIAIPLAKGKYDVLDETGKTLASNYESGQLRFKTEQLGTFFIKTASASIKSVPKKAGGLTIKPPAKAKKVKPQTPATPKASVSSHTSTTTPANNSASVAGGNNASDIYGAGDYNENSTTESALDSADALVPEDTLPDTLADGAVPVEGESTEVLEEKERPGLIILFLILIAAALGGGVYLTRKYYLLFMEEVVYEEDRKRDAS